MTGVLLLAARGRRADPEDHAFAPAQGVAGTRLLLDDDASVTVSDLLLDHNMADAVLLQQVLRMRNRLAYEPRRTVSANP